MQLLRAMRVEDILALGGGGHEGSLRAVLAAELLRIQARMEDDASAEAVMLQDKALALYLHGSDAEVPLSQAAAQLLAHRLRTAHPPSAEVVADYLPLLMQAGRYSEIEDALFLTLDQPLTPAQRGAFARTGGELLQILSGLSDVQLERGGLPREELRQCRQAFDRLVTGADDG